MRKFWTSEEKEQLTLLYPDKYTRDVAKILNRSERAVYSMAKIMELKKSEAFMKMELDKQAERLKKVGVKYRFSKGIVPVNKGQKMSPSVYERSKHTFFTKGHLPHNTKYDGHERITQDGYIEIRVRIGKYRLKHHVVWEENYGAIPKDSVIRFKDANPQNCVPENLYCISKVENMLRNSKHNHPEELIPTLVLKSKLKKVIKNKLKK